MSGARIHLVISLMLLGAFVTGKSYGQVTGAELRGTITDASVAVIPNANVLVRNVATGTTRNTRSNSEGVYTVPELLAGAYEVTVSAPGFSTTIRSNITLTVGQQQVLNFALEVGQVTQKVQVTDAPPAVDLASSTLGGLENAKTTRELPLNGRDWTQLATLEPGVTALRTQRPVGGGRGKAGFGQQLTITGSRPYQNNYRLDGISQNDYLNATPSNVLGMTLGVDAIEEFSVLTGGYNATYGMTSGGVINAITRSGTNQFHGNLFEFLRNDSLDARNFFDRQKPPFRRNQFGGSAGGPIHKDHTFIFGSYEGLRQSLTTTTIDTVPSLAARNGQLSTGNVTVDPKVKPFLGFWPASNGPTLGKGDTAIFSFASNAVSRENFWTARLDHKLSDRDSLAFTYMFDDSNTISPDALNVVKIANRDRRNTASLQETHIFSPQLLHTVRLGFNRVTAEIFQTSPGANPLATDSSLGAVPGRNAPVVVTQVITQFSGGLGGLGSSDHFYTTYQVYDDLALQKGIHSLKFGFGLERYQDNLLLRNIPNGGFQFNSLSDFLTNKPIVFRSDVLQANVPGVQPGTTTAFAMRGFRQIILAAYVQDDVRLRPNLTLNLGLRYEPASVPGEVANRIGNLRSLTDAQVTLGSPYFSNPTLRNFEPRVGFAWDPFHNGKTAVRGSFGIFDSQPLMYQFTVMQGLTAPYFLEGKLSNPPAGSFPNGAYSLMTAGSAIQVRVSTAEPNPRRNYILQWDLNIQRSLMPNLTATVGYAGSRGVHMSYVGDDENIVLPSRTPQGYLWPSPPGSGKVLNPAFGTIEGQIYSENSSYHALQVKVQKRMSHGFQIQGAFTWSKSLDGSSTNLIGANYTNSISSLFFDRSLNRGLSDFNIGRNVVISGLWEVPAPHFGSGIARVALGGWELGGLFQASDGFPFTPLLSGDPLGLNSSTLFALPNRVAGPTCTHLANPGNPNQYIHLSCYSFPNPRTLLGNAGRNSLIAPGLADLDFSILKNVPVRRISESFNLQFRTEIFNLANRANFGLPQNRLFDPSGAVIGNAGLITNTVTTSRQIQFALKLIW